MVHAALLLLMLEAVTKDLVSTISLKRSTQNLAAIHKLGPRVHHLLATAEVAAALRIRLLAHSRRADTTVTMSVYRGRAECAVVMVQVHHDEGVANRIDPESCADAREGIGNELAGSA